MDKAYFDINKYKVDDLRAVDAKFEAQKIAFAPLAFQAIKTMINLGILKTIEDAGDDGITRADLAAKTNLSEYGVGVLCEMALGMNVIKLTEDSESDPKSEKYKLGKTGWMLLEDDLTRVNFWFTNDICYEGAWDLEASIKNGKPEGLKVFSEINIGNPEDIKAYTRDGITVKLGNGSDMAGQARLAENMVGDVKARGLSVEYLDANLASPFIKLKK